MKRPKKRVRRRIVHIFIPHEENGYHPHALRNTAVLLVLAIALVGQIGFLTYETVILKSGSNIAAVLPGAIALLTNEARAEAESAPLAVSDVLTAAAQKKADDMATQGYFAHQEPNGEMPWHWFREAGYDYVYAGENLAVNFTDTQQLVDAWLASPTHRSNIIKKQYSEIGIGMATGVYKGREAIFVVQFFGTRNAPVASATREEPAPNTEIATAETPLEVLGEETANVTHSSVWQKIKISPRTFNMQILIALAVAFLAILAVSLIPRFRAHPLAVFNGFVVVAAIVFLYSFQNSFLGSIELPSDAQAATVSQVL